MKVKVLLIYPTPFRVTGLPVGLAVLSAVLKNGGHKVKIFDTAFYGNKKQESETKLRSQRLVSKEINDEERYLPINDSDMGKAIINIINEYKPDIIGLSIMEMMYGTAIQITRIIKKKFKNIPIIAGGIFPTLSPEIVMNESSIDMICLGEGETALLNLCNRIKTRKSFVDIEGLWVKSYGKIYKNKPSKLHDINRLPYPDFTGFDNRLFYKPMQGKMYKMVNIETSRGCCFNCTYCGVPSLRRFFKENGCGDYINMDIKKVIDQIDFQIKSHHPEFIYFSSSSFLSMSEKDFDMFVSEYEKIKIPFWIQTRIETITRKRLLKLKSVGMHWLTIGLEHGNDEFRKNILKRNYSNKMFFERLDILRDLDMGASINNIIGFPFETRELIFDTIKMNRELLNRNPKLEINVFLFTPYRGCELYNICKKNGLLEDMVFISDSILSGKSVINFSEEFQRDLMGLIRTFNLYVRLPEKYFNKIKIAEQCNKKGDLMLAKLKNQFYVKF